MFESMFSLHLQRKVLRSYKIIDDVFMNLRGALFLADLLLVVGKLRGLENENEISILASVVNQSSYLHICNAV